MAKEEQTKEQTKQSAAQISEQEQLEAAAGEHTQEQPEAAAGEQMQEQPEAAAGEHTQEQPEEISSNKAPETEPVRAVFGVSSDGGTDVRPRFGNDKYSLLWGILSFFAPIVAYALRNLWRANYPMRSKSMLIGSILGIVFYVALFITAIALIVTRFALSKQFM